MRVIVHGAGAVGGTVAAALFRAGIDVVAIARGGMLAAMQARGLRLRAPGIDVTVPVPAVAHPAQIDWRADDMVLLCVKGQDTAAALEDLRAAGVADQPIFCAQNGVANERAALRLFPNVHGITVMMPAVYLTPGEVAVFTEPRLGIFDIGRYPGGIDDDDRRMAAALEAGGVGAVPRADVMASKHGKLLVNLNNVLRAALGNAADLGDLGRAVRAEAEAVYRAAGIAWDDPNRPDPARDALIRPVDALPGVPRAGGSTVQSLLRGAARVETDFLNGEIALMGRLHGVPVPLNAALTRLGARMAQDGLQPGAYTLDTLQAALAAGG
jgi:2-dehydropantoate 2-reductase